VTGHVLVTYNVGAQNLTIGETMRSLSDGRYHTIIFTRYGPNATLQVDSLPKQTRNPLGMFRLQHYGYMTLHGQPVSATEEVAEVEEK